ncbi:ABC transporter ATP-binding protein [Spirulina subsalsa]|uniref:ABC transporter ATP-binding protein n=1 Tax=Spirulina subsalsa TaxID=54311 RepID=UPI000370A800|nr:ABC transporter ATP-binding protein [Spirulina subsalsa]
MNPIHSPQLTPSESTAEITIDVSAKTSSDQIIRMENVTKVYGTGEAEVRALAGVNFRLENHEYCAIMGPSGSGKSTMMNMIGCLDRPTSGRYDLDGIDVTTLSESQLAEVRNRKIGFVFQQYHLLPQSSALDNVVLPMIYAGVEHGERCDRAAAALEKVGLGNRLHYRPNQLSGGQQQRVAIARAIVNHPIILLADEPTGALDSRTANEILDLFTELNQGGMTVILVTHEADVASRTRRIAWFKDGTVLYSHLTPDQIKEVALEPH